MIEVDYESKDVVFMDFETQSFCDLKREGGRTYAADPSTRVACCVFARNEDYVELWVPPHCPHAVPDNVDGHRVWTGEGPPQWVLDAVAEGAVFAAHNALDFDAWVWQHKVHRDGMPVPKWRDTIPLCRAAGLPGGLDAACEKLFSRGKDPRGRVVQVLCQAYLRDGRVQYPVATRSAWLDLFGYCISDGKLLARLHAEVAGYAEPDVIRVHQTINDRGFPIDIDFAARLVIVQDELARKRGTQLSEITEDDLDMASARSTVKVKKWLADNGVKVESLDRRDIKRLLDDPDEFCDASEEAAELAVKVLKLRQDIVRVTISKAIRMMASAREDSRARGQFVYYGAHTGRFSGREVQPHNFPRGREEVDAESLARRDVTLEDFEAEAARVTALDPKKPCSVGDVIGTMLRPVIADGDDMSIADYGAVEARCVAWMCDEAWELALFRDPRADVYVEFAKRVYGNRAISKAERWNAKQAILGCGYGMSGRKFDVMCQMWGVDLTETGVSAAGLIKAYRQQHPKIKQGWREVEQAAINAVEGRPGAACRLEFRREGPHLAMVLPSGRRMMYRSARVEMLVPAYCALLGLPPEKKPTIVYDNPRFGFKATLYGGRIMENGSQAICRDLLAHAAVRTEDEGLRPFFHAHDEIVAKTRDIERLCVVMSEPPDWAEGFPVLVEGFAAKRYYKKAPHDSRVVKALCGGLV